MNTLKTRFLQDKTPEIGVDEAGRGPLWGPLMAAAVILPSEVDWTQEQKTVMSAIKDSKKVLAKKRDALAKEIQSCAIAYGIGIVTAAEIDTIGATRANQMAFRRAITSLEEKGFVAEQKRI